MEQWIVFNGTKILLTTADDIHGIQNFEPKEADLVLSVYENEVKVLKFRMPVSVGVGRMLIP